MHFLLLGVLMSVIEVIISLLNPSKKANPNDLVDTIFVPLRSLEMIISDAVSQEELLISIIDSR